ncbi:alkyl hydroperoxide reductase, partial [bacterium]|nr:alkyl hydroperoxide reductase [bacterium]
MVNDRDFVIWRTYSVKAWPTLFLIDPVGKIIGYRSGEGIYAQFDELIAAVIAEFDTRGLVDRKPIQFDLERYRMDESLLSFP